MVMIYLFFDDFLPPFLPPFFLAAIKLTTFHAVRDLLVALSWQKRRIAPASLVAKRIRGKGSRSTTFCWHKYAMNKRYCQVFDIKIDIKT